MKKFLGIALMILMLVFTLASCDMVKGMIIKHEVTFSLDGGVAGEGYTESVEIGDGKTLTLSTPTREGYNFLGWYSGDTKVTESTPITSDMTLTAKWEI
ncbi:MAG: InlB B-repeat-containing protein, partial [Clostridia bacterium]|nr:InlB B-repeat-containing protein [Clostridia bacterium]